jgi:hypothetical protein
MEYKIQFYLESEIFNFVDIVLGLRVLYEEAA